jgi:protein TonB
MLGVCLELVWTEFSRVKIQSVPEFRIGDSSVAFTVLSRTEIPQPAQKIEHRSIVDMVEEKDSPIEEDVILPSAPHPKEIKKETFKPETVPESIESELPAVPDVPSAKDTGVFSELDLGKTVLRPRYPLVSRLRGEEGDVLVRVEIDKEGGVKKAEILKSSGFSNLDREALNSLKKAKFFTVDGRIASGGEAKISFKFRLVEP